MVTRKSKRDGFKSPSSSVVFLLEKQERMEPLTEEEQKKINEYTNECAVGYVMSSLKKRK